MTSWGKRVKSIVIPLATLLAADVGAAVTHDEPQRDHVQTAIVEPVAGALTEALGDQPRQAAPPPRSPIGRVGSTHWGPSNATLSPRPAPDTTTPPATTTPPGTAPPTTVPPATSPLQPAAVPDYELVWSDEFDGTSLDTNKWSLWNLGPRRQGRNVPEAVEVSDGTLSVTVDRFFDPDNDRYVTTTGGISTRGLFEPTYGYFEARIKPHTGAGAWFSFWLYSPEFGKYIHDHRRSGAEIDIAEFHRGIQNGTGVQHALHWDGYGEFHESLSHHTDLYATDSGFHTVAVRWTPEEYVFYVDGAETWRFAENEGAPVSRVPRVPRALGRGRLLGRRHRSRRPPDEHRGRLGPGLAGTRARLRTPLPVRRDGPTALPRPPRRLPRHGLARGRPLR